MPTLTFPAIRAPNRITWRQIANTQRAESPLSRTVQTVELPSPRWAATLEYNGLEVADAVLMQTFLAQLRGQAGRFWLTPFERKESRGNIRKEKWLALPGVSGNYASTPDSAAVSITGDIDIRVKVALDDWTPAGTTSFVSKNVAGNRSFGLNLNPSGTMDFLYTSDGSTLTGRIATSTVATGVTDGANSWVRVTYNASTGDVTFYLSDDGVVWNQLGATLTITAGNIFDGTATLAIFASSSGTAAVAGRGYYAEIRDGIDGTVVARFNPGEHATGLTWTSSTGEEWTVNTSGSPNAQIETWAGDIEVDGASQTGNSLLTKNWRQLATGLMVPGDYFAVNGELKLLTAQADANSNGGVTLEFEPPLRAAPADDAVVTVSEPVAKMMLVNDVQEWEVVPGKFWNFVIDCVEMW